MSRFPQGFLWGAACASYQCEGGWDADGKGPSIWDEFCHDAAGRHIKNGDTGDVACDSYHRFREDVALMREHNIRAYRFSVSWARVIPDGDGDVNEPGLRYYEELVDELLANGIEPLATLYHWDLPSALQDKGGWLNRDTVEAFGRYAGIFAERMKGKIKKYMTLNEPQCIAGLGYGDGRHAPGLVLGEEKVARVYHHLCLAHSAAYRAVKAAAGADAQVGVVSCGRLTYPQKDTPENRQAAYEATFALREHEWINSFNIFLDSVCLKRYADELPEPVRRFAETVDPADWELMETPDFIGVNAYTGVMVDETGEPVKPYPGFPLTGCKWRVTPEVLHYAPVQLAKRYGLPLYITENGQSCNDRIFLDGQVHDPDRIDYLHRYLLELAKAVAEGVDLRGYMQWSILDNFEWGEGYNERFGIIYVDYRTGRRIPKDSARWYAKVIETNGECL